MDECGEHDPGLSRNVYPDLRAMARDEAQQIILTHLKLCPFAGERISERLRAIETKFATLIGLMIGSGLLGGTVAAALTKLMTK
jgi:hypothetical protein